jgi:hypothetical protein
MHGGGGEIRTRDTVARILLFESSAFNRSATPPDRGNYILPEAKICYHLAMSPIIVSLLFAAGASTWIYTKLQRYSGNNTRQSLIAVAVSAVLIFIVFLFIFNSIIK